MCPDIYTNTELPCPQSSYSLGGQNICTICPAGYEFEDFNRDYQCNKTCDEGFYRIHDELDLGECSPCTAGYACPQPNQLPKNVS